MTTTLIAILVASNVYFVKKLMNKENARKEVVFAKEQLKRNRKVLMNQYLTIGTISERR